MRLLSFLVLAALAASVAGQEQEIHRALIERDQQSAEFAARLNRPEHLRSLENLDARQLGEASMPLSSNPDVARSLRPYQRGVMAEERMRFASPAEQARPDANATLRAPLALPGSAGADSHAIAAPGTSR